MDTKMLFKNIDLNGRDICGLTPFMNTCINGHKNVVLKKH